MENHLLSTHLKPGAQVFVVVKHVARSGMSRRLAFYVNDPESGRMLSLSYALHELLGWRFHRDDCAVVVQGCGMDMGFHTLDCAMQKLHGRGASANQVRIQYL